MVTVCTQILANNSGFISSASALAVTNLCFLDTPSDQSRPGGYRVGELMKFGGILMFLLTKSA